MVPIILYIICKIMFIRIVSTISDALVVATSNLIHQISLDGRRVKTLVSGLQLAIAVDFHYRYILLLQSAMLTLPTNLRWGYLFWTDVIEGSISRANLDGSMRTTLLEGLESPGTHDIIIIIQTQ